MLLNSELEHEVRRESISIALNRFVEAERGNAIDLRQVAVEDDFLSADFTDQFLNSLVGKHEFLGGHIQGGNHLDQERLDLTERSRSQSPAPVWLRARLQTNRADRAAFR